MQNFGERDLAYHHAEIARLTELIAKARPDARRTGMLRTLLKFHEDIIGRPTTYTGNSRN
jgi:hypothetical protein